MPGVTITGLTKRYGDVAAIEGLDLQVPAGELVSLLGPSGCGKTTTLRLVAGFLRPEAGEVWVGERCPSSPASVGPARTAAHGDDLPELCALAPHDGCPERRVRSAFQARRIAGGP